MVRQVSQDGHHHMSMLDKFQNLDLTEDSFDEKSAAEGESSMTAEVLDERIEKLAAHEA